MTLRPALSSNTGHASHRIRNAGITIHQHTLDLDQSPTLLPVQVQALAARLAGTTPV